MRRPVVFLLAVFSSACATATMAGEDNNTPDAPSGNHQQQQDAGTQSMVDASPSQGTDAGTTTQPDAGNPPPGSCSTPYSGVIGTWSFSGQSGSESSVSGSPGASGASIGDLSRSSSLGTQTGSNSINSTDWPTGSSLDTSKGYYTFAITPPSGCSLSLTGAALTTRTSSTGPSKLAIATSADSFGSTQTLGAGSDIASSPSLSVSGSTDAVELRVFGWDASGSNGTMRIEDTLTVSGSLQ